MPCRSTWCAASNASPVALSCLTPEEVQDVTRDA
eukprot:CAMPEP_0115325808 /NCGR_PEP_ID=MMETSP0270-20121206/83220_1 /TAXON_ID=71861 /ORGANISM="Scrippsiella trochoidea, Strain CCMP3099" /LENGTH=33 /DNA_ID= /DNA_START= /DNA_END= /DNA_ORIENTATION=